MAVAFSVVALVPIPLVSSQKTVDCRQNTQNTAHPSGKTRGMKPTTHISPTERQQPWACILTWLAKRPRHPYLQCSIGARGNGIKMSIG